MIDLFPKQYVEYRQTNKKPNNNQTAKKPQNPEPKPNHLEEHCVYFSPRLRSCMPLGANGKEQDAWGKAIAFEIWNWYFYFFNESNFASLEVSAEWMAVIKISIVFWRRARRACCCHGDSWVAASKWVIAAESSGMNICNLSERISGQNEIYSPHFQNAWFWNTRSVSV